MLVCVTKKKVLEAIRAVLEASTNLPTSEAPVDFIAVLAIIEWSTSQLAGFVTNLGWSVQISTTPDTRVLSVYYQQSVNRHMLKKLTVGVFRTISASDTWSHALPNCCLRSIYAGHAQDLQSPGRQLRL